MGLSINQHPAAIMAGFNRQILSSRDWTLTSEDPEGPHQLRVGLRRLRSGLWLFRPLLPPGYAKPLSLQARWLGQETGHLRDLEVLLYETVQPYLKATGGDKTLAALDRHLTVAVRRQKQDLVKTLHSERVARFLEEADPLNCTGFWIASAGQAAALRDLCRAALDLRHRQAHDLGRHFRGLDEPDRHEFRKTLKKLRYTAECANAVFAAPQTKAYIKQLKVLQEGLGAMNDAVVAREILTSITSDLAPDAPARIAAMALADVRDSHVNLDKQRIQKLWKALAKKDPL